jgi:hypothetical protein
VILFLFILLSPLISSYLLLSPLISSYLLLSPLISSLLSPHHPSSFISLLTIPPDYSVGTGSVEPNQYVVADSYANPSALAEQMNLPYPSGQQQPVNLEDHSYRIEGHMIDDGGRSEKNKKKKKKKKKKKEKSFYQLGYYKELFDFDTNEILQRVWNASNPLNYVDFWEDIKDKPDFYVPLWGTTTLWFLLVVCGEIATSLVNSECQIDGYYFQKVGWGAFALYGYLFILPFIWLLLFKFWLEIPLTFFGHISLHGYSLLPYIPTMVSHCVSFLFFLFFSFLFFSFFFFSSFFENFSFSLSPFLIPHLLTSPPLLSVHRHHALPRIPLDPLWYLMYPLHTLFGSELPQTIEISYGTRHYHTLYYDFVEYWSYYFVQIIFLWAVLSFLFVCDFLCVFFL